MSGYGGYSQNREEKTEIVFEASPEPEKIVVVDGDTIIYSPEVAPVFPGGEAAIDAYFQKQLPGLSKTETKKNNKSIWVSFVILSSGKIGRTNIIGSDKPEMNEKITEILKSMPAWTPATNKGRDVATIGDFTFYFH